MSQAETEALIRYLTEERRHYLALAANTERLLNIVKGGTLAPQQEVRYNVDAVSYTPAMEHKTTD